MKKLTLATAVCMSLFATNALAGGAAPFYLGATIGQSSVNNDVYQMDNQNLCASASTTSETCSIGDGGTAGHIYGGIQLSDSIAVEIGYADLGSTAEYYYTDPVDINQETSGYTVAGVMRHRLGKSSPMHVYGKAGVFRWTTETTSSQDYPGTTEASGTSPMAGVGIEYELSHNMSLKAGWDRYYSVGESDKVLNIGGFNSNNSNNVGYSINTLETDVDVYSAGVNFSFY